MPWPAGGYNDFPRSNKLTNPRYLRNQVLIETENLLEERKDKIKILDEKYQTDALCYISLKMKLERIYDRKLILLRKVQDELDAVKSRRESNESLPEYMFACDILKIIYDWRNTLHIHEMDIHREFTAIHIHPINKYFYQFDDTVKSIHMNGSHCYVLTKTRNNISSIYELSYRQQVKAQLLSVRSDVLSIDLNSIGNGLTILFDVPESKSFFIKVEMFDGSLTSFCRFTHLRVEMLNDTRLLHFGNDYVIINGGFVFVKKPARRLKQVFKNIEGVFARRVGNILFFLNTNRRLLMANIEECSFCEVIVPMAAERLSFQRDIIDRIKDGWIFLSNKEYIYLVDSELTSGAAYLSEPIFGIAGIVDYVIVKHEIIFSIRNRDKRDRIFFYHYNL